MDTTQLKGLINRHIGLIKKGIGKDRLDAAYTAIDAVDIFMENRFISHESYIDKSMSYINQNFEELGEEGLLLIADKYFQNVFLLKEIVKNRKIIKPEYVLFLAIISYFHKDVCIEIIENYEDDILVEKLIAKMQTYKASGQLDVVVKAIGMSYISNNTARKISAPFKKYGEVSRAMLTRVLKPRGTTTIPNKPVPQVICL